MFHIDHLKTKCYGKGLVTKLPDGSRPVISKMKDGESLQELVERHEAEIKAAIDHH